VTVDGNDAVTVFQAAGRAVERARKGEGPTLLECQTYRHKGHSRFDPATYRPEEEVKEWMKRDPIMRLRKKLIQQQVLSEEEANEIDKRIMAHVEQAAEFALESSYPELEEALEDVFVTRR